MKKIILLSMTLIMLLGLAESASAKSVIKRVAIEDVQKLSVAMAIETYDGDFFDLSEFKNSKYKGNAQDIIKKGYVEHKTGAELDANAIKYFFVEKVQKSARRGLFWKRPHDDENL